jgi:hypothetical protein
MTIDEINEQILVCQDRLKTCNDSISKLVDEDSDSLSTSYISLMKEVDYTIERIEYLITQLK